jgi:lipoprotein NlpI
MSRHPRSPPPGQRRWALGCACGLVCLTVVAFWPSLDNGFTNWDDNAYVIENPHIKGFTLHNVAKVFSSAYQSNYQPLTMLTYMVEHQLFAMDAAAYHRTNLGLHCLNALLVFALFSALSRDRLVSLTVATLFAIHPLRVESVAWIAERKDVLSGLFYLLSLLFYLRARGDGSRRYRWLCGGALLCSLLAKPMAVSQPLVLLGLDYLGGRTLDRRAVVEKLPYFALASGFATIALVTQHVASADPGQLAVALSLTQRLGAPFYGLAFYVLKSIAPIALCASYPFPEGTDRAALLPFLVAPVVVLAGAWAVYRMRARSRTVVFGALFFVVTALPVLQIVPVGTSVVAERYTYIPALGLYLLVGAGVRHLVSEGLAKQKLAKVLLGTGAGVATVVLASLTYARCSVWKDSLSLWTDVIDKHPSALAYNNRGSFHGKRREYGSALADLDQAIRLRPTYALAYFNRANVYRNLGELDRSIDDSTRAILHCPTYGLAYYYRGVTYCMKGDYDRGIADLTRSITMAPGNAEAFFNRGLAYVRTNDRERAAQDFARACALGEGAACQILGRG